MQDCRWGCTRAEQRGKIPSLDLMATFLLMHPRILLAFWAARSDLMEQGECINIILQTFQSFIKSPSSEYIKKFNAGLKLLFITLKPYLI